ncbi:MAG: Flp pilus assembly complex ATPase component TadA [Candidatus Omnitrophica bacterium]|nr:Flp pilus assembly complex ATPase component TadA [Candidatus Omnitrophota bacterium]
MASSKERIVEVLLNNQLIKPEQLEEAFKVQQATGGSLRKILVERGFIKEADFMSAVSQGLGIPPISLTRMKIDTTLKALIPRELAKQYEVIPVACIGQTLTVAMTDPLNVFALDTLTTMTGLTVNPLLTTTKEIQEAIDLYYGTGVEETLKEIVKKTEALSVEVVSKRTDETESSRLLKMVEDLPVVRVTDAVLTRAVRLRASDVLIEPMENAMRIRYRVDGVLQEGEAPPRQFQLALVSRIKVMAELNIAEHRLPQDGHFNFKIDDRAIDLRVSVLPSSFGETVVLRIQDKGTIKLNIDDLGFRSEDLDLLKACAKRPHGMILSTGPTGSGKTTTLYALLTMIDRPEKNLVTVEDPVEFQLEGINQVPTRVDIGLSFARSLRAILRQDPDVIMVGEIRDAETADMAVKSALTGHLVLSTLHTNSAVGSVVRLVNMGVEPFLLNSCLMAVIGQRLVRRLCPRCKQPYQPPKPLAERIGLVDERGRVPEIAKPTGCSACAESGYRGREVIAEVLPLAPEIRELIVKRAQERQIEEAARAAGMNTLREHGIQKVRDQITSLDELFRTTVGESIDA